MESNGVDPARSETVLDSLQFTEELRRLMAVSAPENGSSFTALLELPAPQAVELLHAPESGDGSAGKSQGRHCFNNGSFQFPTNGALIESAAKYSVFAAESNGSPASSSVCSKQNVKCEGAETGSNPNSGLGQQQPSGSDPMEDSMAQRSVKRKEREKKAKGSSKKSKNESSEDAEKLPCVHVRARRGQATDSHSLAERARREKINARMKLLQELVPGCNKISGTALVLDEIINHVQSLQRQVELLSMKLAAVNPRVDFDLDSILGAEGGPLVDNNYSGFVMAPQWPDINTFGSRQQYQQQWHFDALHLPIMGRGEENQNLVTPENSLLSYDSSVNSVSLHQNLHPNHVKMEL